MSDANARFASRSRSSERSLPYAVRMPIDGSADSMDAAVQQLADCDPTDLRRARRHHRRALAALENGSYETLTDDTRARLVHRLRTDLEALDRALNRMNGPSSSASDSPDPSGDAPSGDPSASASDTSGWTGWFGAAFR